MRHHPFTRNRRLLLEILGRVEAIQATLAAVTPTVTPAPEKTGDKHA